MRIHKKLPAFALVETAIALCILGIIGYMTLPLLGNVQLWQRTRTTQTHQEKIMEALAGYVLANKRLPCPAKTSDGEALSICTGHEKSGFVPYKTLGIDAKMAKNGNNHWMTYVVQPSLTSSKIQWIQPMQDLKVDPKTIFCTTPHEDILGVINEQHESCVVKPDFVAAVIISHGNSGGYILDSGAVQPVTSLDPDKITNAQRGDQYITKALQNREAAIFDDTVMFASRNNLMAQWAKFPCKH